jgi:hypothetical protein
MNAADCCDIEGKCVQGKNCPAREAPEPRPPEPAAPPAPPASQLNQANSDGSSPDGKPGWAFTMLMWACLIWALCVVLGLLSGYLVVKVWP